MEKLQKYSNITEILLSDQRFCDILPASASKIPSGRYLHFGDAGSYFILRVPNAFTSSEAIHSL
jgi:hypothetical protein